MDTLTEMAHTSNQPVTEVESQSGTSSKGPKPRQLPKDRKNEIIKAPPSPIKASSTSSPVEIPAGMPIRNSEERDAVNRAIEQRIRDQDAELQLEQMREEAKEFRRTRNRRNTETEDLIASQQQQGRQANFGKGKAGTRSRAPTKFFGSAVDSQKAIARSPQKRQDPKRSARVDTQLTQHAKRMTSKLEVMSLSQLQHEEGAETSFEQSSPEKSSPEKSPEKQ